MVAISSGVVGFRRQGTLPELREPDRMPAAGGIFDDMRKDIKPAVVEEQAIFRFVQAAVVKGVALIRSDSFPK